MERSAQGDRANVHTHSFAAEDLCHARQIGRPLSKNLLSFMCLDTTIYQLNEGTIRVTSSNHLVAAVFHGHHALAQIRTAYCCTVPQVEITRSCKDRLPRCVLWIQRKPGESVVLVHRVCRFR